MSEKRVVSQVVRLWPIEAVIGHEVLNGPHMWVRYSGRGGAVIASRTVSKKTMVGEEAPLTGCNNNGSLVKETTCTFQACGAALNLDIITNNRALSYFYDLVFSRSRCCSRYLRCGFTMCFSCNYDLFSPTKSDIASWIDFHERAQSRDINWKRVAVALSVILISLIIQTCSDGTRRQNQKKIYLGHFM